MEEILTSSFIQATTQNVWAALAIASLFYINRAQQERDKKQDLREENYQDIILELTKQLQIVKSIQKDIKNIRSDIAESHKKK